MKTTIRGVIGAIALLLATAVHTFAIEGLQISVQCSNVVLSWPSGEFSGDTYIVEYRPTLSSTDSWQMLTNYMPPDSGTNFTTFVHSNIVQNPVCDGGAGMFAPMSSDLAPLASDTPSGPMVVDSAGDMAPLSIYPPGFDLSIFTIFDPSTGETISGSGLVTSDSSGASPLDPSGSDGSGTSPDGIVGSPETGFYQVVRDGLHLFGLTNDTVLSGVVQIAVEAGYDQGILSSVVLNANGDPIPGTQMFSQPFAPLIDDASNFPASPEGSMNFTVDTRRLANGDYYLQANGKWAWSPTNGYGIPFVDLSSPTVLVHITNAISFPDWIQEFRDDLMQFNITSAETNIDWKVDVYGQAGDYVISFTNHSDDGSISFSWNLLDTNGIPRSDLSFTTVTTISDPDTETNPPLIRVVDNYPSQGMWVVARADYIPTNAQNYDLYVGVENGFAQIGESAGGVLPGSPNRNPGEALYINRLGNVGAFFQSFTNPVVRNFYFDGHGGPDWIGFFPGPNGTSNRMISSSLVAHFLNTEPPNTNSIRYRWVMIDSCNSANGDWPQAFGIGNRENVALTNYMSRPAAFCGFTTETYGYTELEGGSEIDINTIDWRSYFQLFWFDDNNALKDSFDEATTYTGDYNDDDYLKVYGYWGLGYNDFNFQADWPLSP